MVVFVVMRARDLLKHYGNRQRFSASVKRGFQLYTLSCAVHSEGGKMFSKREVKKTTNTAFFYQKKMEGEAKEALSLRVCLRLLFKHCGCYVEIS